MEQNDRIWDLIHVITRTLQEFLIHLIAAGLDYQVETEISEVLAVINPKQGDDLSQLLFDNGPENEMWKATSDIKVL